MQATRTVRAGGFLLAFCLAMTACGEESSPAAEPTEGSSSPASLEGQELVFGNFGQYTPEGLLEDFTAETGVEVTLSEFGDNEEMVGLLGASQGTGYDVVMVTGGTHLQTLVDSGWVAELDHGQIPNISNLAPAATELAFDPGNRYSVPYTWGTTGLCYRTDLVDTEINSWNQLLDPPAELDGKVTILETDRWLLQPALLSLGYSVNTEDPAEIEEAKELTIAAKEHVLEFNDTNFWERLDDGSAGMVHAWDGWCNFVADPSVVEFVVPDEGSDAFADTMVIMESSENKEAAHAFINYILAPENHVQVAEFSLFKVPNEAAMEMLDPELLETYPNLAIPPEEFLAYEANVPLSDEGQRLWSEAVAEVQAA